MTVNRSDNNLSRFQFSCPAWWEGVQEGRRSVRWREMELQFRLGNDTEADKQWKASKEIR